MSDRIRSVEAYALRIPRETPYLGPLGEIQPNRNGYFVRPKNRTVYSVHEHSAVVRIITEDGVIGWGEALSPVAPGVTARIIGELLAPFVEGREASSPAAVYTDLYDMMRVRGYWGGFYGEALAAVDMALWDICGKRAGCSVAQLLGGKRRERIPAYVSGLPKETLDERAAYAAEWLDKGYHAVKFAAVVAGEGETREIEAIRRAVGEGPQILADLHWSYTAKEAIRLIDSLREYDLYLAEAPVDPQDTAAQARVCAAVPVLVGIGEELRTLRDFRTRFELGCMDVVQPEMGRLGITAFWDVCRLAEQYNIPVMPHASIGVGIFQAASLQCSAAAKTLPYHEFQHSVFESSVRFLQGGMTCERGFFTLPSAPGIGVEPVEDLLCYTMD